MILPKSGFAEETGNALKRGLDAILEHKLEKFNQQYYPEMERQRYAKALEPIVGPKVAKLFSHLPPEERKAALQDIPIWMQLANRGGIGGAENSPQRGYGGMQQGGLPQAPQGAMQALANGPAATPPNAMDILGGGNLGGPESDIVQALQGERLQPEMGGFQQQEGPTERQLLGKLFQNPQKHHNLVMEQQAQERNDLKRMQLAQQQEASKSKATQQFREEVLKKAQAAKLDLKDLNRMEELEDSGKLDTPGYIEFLKRSGLDISNLKNPETEEFQKIAANFLRDAKTYFGGRITNLEMEQFLKTIPDLSQSPEGRKRVIANLKYMKRGALEHSNAVKDIIKANGGIPPYNISELADELLDTKLESLSEKFKKDLARPVPTGQAGYKTFLQSAAGSVLGVPGKLIGAVGNLLSKVG